jgi:hypothetical protein
MFTYNNPTKSHEDMEALIHACEKARYAVYQLEHAPNTGTPHYQGYVEFSSPVRLSYCRRLLDAHWERRRGTRDQARDYCMKEDSRAPNEEAHEIGEWRAGGRGSRNDFRNIVADIRAGSTTADLAEAYPGQYIRYSNGIEKMVNIFTTARNFRDPLEVILYYGPPGSGKTYAAFQGYPDLFRKSPGSRWFDGYCGQKTALLDDFAGASSHWTLVFLLQVIDKYPMFVEIKGGHVHWNVSTVIITSNIHPRLWYKWDDREVHYAALKRRFSKVVFCKNQDEHQDVSIDTFFDDFAVGLDYDSYCLPATLPLTPV